MFLIDDILLSPVRGVAWIARQVLEAVQQDQEAEEGRLTAALGELYMMLETGAITETEFDARESELLDRLDSLQEGEMGDGEESHDKVGDAG